MKRLHTRCQTLLLAVTCCGLLAGCGSANRLVPVEGVVTLDGQPLAEATVSLQPISAADPGPFSAVTDETGRYSLSPSDNPGKNGVVPGIYRLIITTLKTASTGLDDGQPPEVLAPEKVPDEYRTGNIRFEIPPGGTQEADFNISRGR